jgi:hypothetical protein
MAANLAFEVAGDLLRMLFSRFLVLVSDGLTD